MKTEVKTGERCPSRSKAPVRIRDERVLNAKQKETVGSMTRSMSVTKSPSGGLISAETRPSRTPPAGLDPELPALNSHWPLPYMPSQIGSLLFVVSDKYVGEKLRFGQPWELLVAAGIFPFESSVPLPSLNPEENGRQHQCKIPNGCQLGPGCEAPHMDGVCVRWARRQGTLSKPRCSLSMLCIPHLRKFSEICPGDGESMIDH